MKKSKLMSLLILCSFSVCTLFYGCMQQNEGENSTALQMSTKYYYKYDAKPNLAENERGYFLFHQDGTGEYRRYDDAYYTVSFKYTFVDKEREVVACFYNGVRYDNPDGQEAPSTWSAILTVSENVLRETSENVYINANYLSEIPKFGE